VVRDKRTMKSKGFGFISFKDPDDFVRAWREMNGKLRQSLTKVNATC
jgi:RNA recognition motif-containing protein